MRRVGVVGRSRRATIAARGGDIGGGPAVRWRTMAPVSWSLQVRGRLRSRATLVDADGRRLAKVVRDGRVRSMRAGGAKDADGRAWRVVGPSESLRVSCDGEERATIDDGVLEVGDRAYGWRLAEDGSRTVRATSASGGGTVLRIDPGEGDAWARIEFDDELPEPFAVVLAASVRLLEAEDPIFGAGGPGSGSREERAAERAARRQELKDRRARRDAEPREDAPSEDGGEGSAVPAAVSSGHGVPPEDAPAPGMRWALFIEGRARPRVLLSDGGEEALATLELRGGAPGTLGRATDRDGRSWVAELDGGVVTMRCAGRAMARAEGQELIIGGRRLAWEASLEGERTAAATDDDGRELLRIDRGPDDGPWVVIALDDELPSPMAATLASLFVLLRVDALGRRG